MLWACVLLPHLALDTVLRRHPAPDEPLALVSGPLQRRVLSAVNDAAAARGLHRGQSIAAAEALCVDLQVLDDDPARRARARDFLAAWAYRYSSQVSTDIPGALLLEVQGSLGLFGPWPAFEARLREDLAALGFRHRIALAPTAAAAAVLAGHQDVLAVTSHDVLRRALASVPVARARLPGGAAPALERMAIRTLGQVLALPRGSLGQRFGAPVLAHLDQLLGQAPETLALYRPPDAFDEKIELNYDVESLDAIIERKSYRSFHCVDDLQRRWKSARFLGCFLPCRSEVRVCIGNARAEVAQAPKRLPLTFGCECDRTFQQIASDDRVDRRCTRQRLCRDLRAGQDHVERFLDADRAGKSLRATSSRQNPKLHLRKADLRVRNRDSIVAGQCELESASEREAVNCRDHRLRGRLDGHEQFAGIG